MKLVWLDFSDIWIIYKKSTESGQWVNVPVRRNYKTNHSISCSSINKCRFKGEKQQKQTKRKLFQKQHQETNPHETRWWQHHALDFYRWTQVLTSSKHEWIFQTSWRSGTFHPNRDEKKIFRGLKFWRICWTWSESNILQNPENLSRY